MNTESLSALNEALKRIRLAHESGASELILAKLERLPDELAALTALHTLDLRWCEQLQYGNLSDSPRFEQLSYLRSQLRPLHHRVKYIPITAIVALPKLIIRDF